MSFLSGLIPTIVGGLEIAAGVAGIILTGGLASPVSTLLIVSGAGMVISGIGTMLSGTPVKGFSSAERNSIAPWRVIYGEARVGGTMVYQHAWGDNLKVLDMVFVLAAHPCNAVDELLF